MVSENNKMIHYLALMYRYKMYKKHKSCTKQGHNLFDLLRSVTQINKSDVKTLSTLILNGWPLRIQYL